MMALQILLLIEVIVILFSPSSSYPIYGTKRYGRSPVRVSSWPPYQMVRTQRHPNYYDLYPYSQSDDYYSDYPVYYPRTSKYEVYQAVLPYYPNYYYNPTDMQEEMLQEAEREEREESQPIGHEMLYENEDQEDDQGFEEANAAFLQNLIMSQMYQDSNQDYEEYGKWENSETAASRHHQEDEDVKELKQLARPNPKDVHWFQHGNYRRQNEQKRESERKGVVKAVPSSTVAPKRDTRGQKEEVQMRPAAPVRHPFSSPIMEMLTKQNERKRSPSVYDTIKHMLDMEKSLENKYGSDIRPRIKKSLITSEESLAKQLTVLKKFK